MNLSEDLPSMTTEQALDVPSKDTRSKNLKENKLKIKGLESKKKFLDMTELIRSIQRGEGNPDCFRRAQDYCDQHGCAWRQYCLGKSQCWPY